jgi:hypothetical protein
LKTSNKSKTFWGSVNKGFKKVIDISVREKFTFSKKIAVGAFHYSSGAINTKINSIFGKLFRQNLS